MKLKVFNTIILSLLCLVAFAQSSLTGIVKSATDSTVIVNSNIYLSDDHSSETSNKDGVFVFENIANGQYTILVNSIGYKIERKTFVIKNTDVKLEIYLQPSTEQLDEVTITDKRNDFGFSHLKAVENLGIYEGKKSEVIRPDQLVANLSTNNARQVYSKVAGLNIWESDGAGIQLSIGGRGLDPNRTSNFNTRQNGYDISADALGYPESYYTPPNEAVEQIQLVRGAASLQYGTQFGGLLNFIMKKPNPGKAFEITARQTLGSYGFYNTFTSVSGTVKKISYYSFFQYKTGSGYRGNSDFNTYTGYANINYQFSNRTKLSFEYTLLDYLAHQPGGLSDEMFKIDPTQSNRERNWFKVNWNLFALNFDHEFNANNKVNIRVFGLDANRYTVGFRPNRVATTDFGTEPRDLIKGDFNNWGIEGRYLKRFKVFNKQSVLLLGTRYYHGRNHSIQGQGTNGKDADFNFVQPEIFTANDYVFPNRNTAFFAENIFKLSEKLSIIPGLRYEFIHTKAEGYYGTVAYDLAGNIINHQVTPETRDNKRNFLLAGLGLSYKPINSINLYANLSQNYRSITFSDMRVSNPSSVIDPNLQDEKGFSFDLGVRSENQKYVNYDISAFYLNYNNRIGEVQFYDQSDRILRLRTNIGQAVIIGLESYGEADLTKIVNDNSKLSTVLFVNAAYIKSDYRKSQIPGVKGNEVEFVPALNLKSGIRLGYEKWKASFQYTHLSDQFSDASNAVDGGLSAVVGLIPAYTVMDFSASYEYKRYKIEGSINNLANAYYFTRRATGYPGPGIIPSDNRTFYLTLQVKL
ncbi:TonB-dependent receptor domain-containing protein [Pedobacter aquatilis]|uniref:TonB-dependent receptor domain-containing protein n=1 Tax=Pedobacter aquatilis TaxID=351343 RepID=UPI002931B203|nr:TonB-dependent receptor [Pedobacter aquatilis]